MLKTATISDCGQYRYLLGRDWSEGETKRRAVWAMLNPSTADAKNDDPTIRRCISFTRDWGFNCLQVVNLCAWRATQPIDLLLAADPTGPDNIEYQQQVANALTEECEAGVVVFAWGANGRFLPNGAREAVVKAFKEHAPACLGRTADGSPRHPLYVRGDQQLVPY